MWTCPKCDRRFANRNQTHACGRFDLDRVLGNHAPEVVGVFERFRDEVLRCGPAAVVPERTRIAFQARMSFAAVTPRARWLDGHLVLAKRVLDRPLAAVTIVLALGIYALYRGGDFGRSWSNKLMRLRVVAQAVAVAVLMGAIWWRTRH